MRRRPASGHRGVHGRSVENDVAGTRARQTEAEVPGVGGLRPHARTGPLQQTAQRRTMEAEGVPARGRSRSRRSQCPRWCDSEGADRDRPCASGRQARLAVLLPQPGPSSSCGKSIERVDIQRLAGDASAGVPGFVCLSAAPARRLHWKAIVSGRSSLLSKHLLAQVPRDAGPVQRQRRSGPW